MIGPVLVFAGVAATGLYGARRPIARLDTILSQPTQIGTGSKAKAKSQVEEIAEIAIRLDPRDVPDVLLVAILLAGTAGKESPKALAARVLAAADHDLGNLSSIDRLHGIEGISPLGKARLLAAAELARRGACHRHVKSIQKISRPEDAVEVIRAMAPGDQESAIAIYLDRRNKMIAARLLTRGSASASIIDPTQILQHALRLGASSIILGHNHPSGDTSPSNEDIAVTKQVKSALQSVNLRLFDHIVVTPTGWESMAQLGMT